MENLDTQFLKDELPKFVTEYAEKVVDARVELNSSLQEAWMKKVDETLDLLLSTTQKSLDQDLKVLSLISTIWDQVKGHGNLSNEIVQKIERLTIDQEGNIGNLKKLQSQVKIQSSTLKQHSAKFVKYDFCIKILQIFLILLTIISVTVIVTLNWNNVTTFQTWLQFFIALIPFGISGIIALVKRSLSK